GSSVPLHVTGGGGYQWTVVSGTANSLNNPNTANPIASPTVTTTYAVQSTNTSFCPQLNKDTVTVTVVPLTYPSVNIIVSPDSNINSGTNVVFIAGTANCSNPGYQWKLNGTNIPGATNSTFSSSTLNDNDKISCMLSCAVSNVITMHVTSSINELSAEQGIEVYPNPNKGEFIVKNVLFGTRIIICNLYGQEIYTGIATEDETRILVPELPNGIYLLKAQSAFGAKTIRINIIN
ncbi:MAG: T9SS type A sorting domain-containing protein, partial [Taibaiella sp.]|nr:T9SS type A sorting domain-containing protein [Taibaiella sp.]